MRTHRHSSLILTLAAVAAFALPGLACASDGTIAFTGLVTGSTCQINASTSATTIAVSLPEISSTALANAGSVAGRTPFSIALSNCTSSLTKVQTYFEPGATVNALSNNLILQGAGSAANVELQLLNADKSKVLLGNSLANQNTQTAAIKAGNANLTYYVQYAAPLAPAGSGSANSSVTFTMVYQ